jgi:hypothetical protein
MNGRHPKGKSAPWRQGFIEFFSKKRRGLKFLRIDNFWNNYNVVEGFLVVQKWT